MTVGDVIKASSLSFVVTELSNQDNSFELEVCTSVCCIERWSLDYFKFKFDFLVFRILNFWWHVLILAGNLNFQISVCKF